MSPLSGHRASRAIWSSISTLGIVVAFAAVAPSALAGQPVPEEIRRERDEFGRWLKDAPTSPYRALLMQAIGSGITLGPAAADIPLPGQGLARIEERRGVPMLTVAGATQPMGRNRIVALGSHRIVAAGPAGRSVVVAYGETAPRYRTPTYFSYRPAWRLLANLAPPARPATARVLAPDGIEAEATEAGTITVPLPGGAVTLRVLRIPAADGEESDLEIYFRDGTNDRGSYPAGRFVSLVPNPQGGFVLDFNRSRNPFCAYNTAYPCPAPWRGNTVPIAIPAGEQYDSNH